MKLLKRVQQGDCILVYVDTIPEGSKTIEFDGIVLRGEGANTHAITDIHAVSAYESNGKLFLHLRAENSLKHAEHGCNVLSPGIVYRVIEREWDYESEEARNARD
jgi:hypothetical protein